MRLLAVLACSAFLLPVTSASADDKAAYASCTACHLADGAGIPGAFPPLRNRVAAIAGLEGGREYLIAVVSSGLMGQIEVAGIRYFGVMPGNKGPMSPADIAAAINHVASELVDDKSKVSDFRPITAEEVADVQAGTATGSPAAAAELRKELVARHGERWPK